MLHKDFEKLDYEEKIKWFLYEEMERKREQAGQAEMEAEHKQDREKTGVK